MKLKNIKQTIEILKKLNLPSSPIIRTRVFRILTELEQEQAIITKLDESYKTEDFISNEQKKYDFVKQFENCNGILVFGIKVPPDKITDVVKGIESFNSTEVYKQYQEYVTYLETQYFITADLLNIDELSDNIFVGLSSEDVELLMEIIK